MISTMMKMLENVGKMLENVENVRNTFKVNYFGTLNCML